METKRKYIVPQVERIELDNEISLILTSPVGAPPAGPFESQVAPEYFNNNPFKDNRA